MPRDTLDARPRSVCLRKPKATDGSEIWSLVKSCKPLDENSMYANLIQADHFKETCVVAEVDGKIAGWVSGHIIPDTDALFVWQVAVSPQARGLGLGKRMLIELIERDACRDSNALKTTITRDNDASWALFKSFARSIGGSLEDEPHFERDAHFEGQHATEHMVTVSLPKASALRRAA